MRTGCDTTSQGAKAWAQASSQASFGAFVVLLCSSLLCPALPAPKSPMFTCHTSHIIESGKAVFLAMADETLPTNRGRGLWLLSMRQSHPNLLWRQLGKLGRSQQTSPTSPLIRWIPRAQYCVLSCFGQGIDHHNPTSRSLA